MSKSINYWIINNPYHINDIELYNSKYEGENCFIAIEHRKITFDKSDKVYYFQNFKGFYWFIINLFKLRIRLKKIGIREIDRIFVFNGQEQTNNILLSIIAKKYCNNIIIVDDGSSGYQFYLTDPVYSNRFSDIVRKLFFKFFGVKYDVMRACNLYYLCLHRSYVKKIIFPYLVSYEGSIEVECFQRKFDNEITLNEKHAVFISQPFYLCDPGYLSFDSYTEMLEKILRILCAKYEKVFLKLHPNDHPSLSSLLSLKAIPNFELIEGEHIFEKIIHNLAVKNLISFNSNALLTSFGSNHETIWLYKLVSEQCTIDFKYLNYIVPNNNGKIIEQFTQI